MFIKILKDNLFVAPIGEDPQRILDIGTGSGIWAIDVADQYPSAEVIGVDISPVQPSFVPPNCRFELDDATQPWTFQENHFDFIHIRMMNGCVPDWTAFYRQALKHIRPGGWFEQVELSIHTHCDDGSLPDDSVFHKWAHLFIEIGQKIGRTFEVAESAPEWLKAAGFVNVTNQTIKVPLGPWAKEKHLKELGLWSRVYLENNLEGFALKVTTMFAGWSVEEAQVFFAKMRKSLRDPSIHSYIYLKVVTGQKANE
ncbi:SAM dependent methyltransferase [Eremomyces bilateralis CBS 781.70]|uniref:SAM dependent methyltransferase n=1 Tax=Eremomyces bilateralis CBS 781.70 TaxID=1392243 RepID=A0A6G1GI61_9PEZI|nr:SAM dependent methyltransferase [Eremomyces bilateralis CBS 781.70]KAF1817550.1 SAM dependent methyltransferase [Eremomyces bilateralis CBS 781.70]